MIVCIPLYVWGSESFSVNLSLHETPRYAMNTSYDDYRYSPSKSPNAVDYLLEGVGGIVGGVVCFVVPIYIGCKAFPEGAVLPDGLAYGLFIAMPASQFITGLDFSQFRHLYFNSFYYARLQFMA